MYRFFATIEQSQLSTWMREDPYAYFIALIFHTAGMALLIGGGIVISLGVLVVGKDLTLRNLRGYLPAMWLGTALALASGLMLLLAYPAKALTNPVFAAKFIFLISATLLLRALLRCAPPDHRARVLAAVALALWLAGVAAGKLLLHTYTILSVT
jgi:hypothetical protein